jgi:hypothetical protein
MFKSYSEFIVESVNDRFIKSEPIYDLIAKLPLYGQFEKLDRYQANSAIYYLEEAGFKWIDIKRNDFASLQVDSRQEAKVARKKGFYHTGLKQVFCLSGSDMSVTEDIYVRWIDWMEDPTNYTTRDFEKYFKLKPEKRGYNLKKFGV